MTTTHIDKEARARLLNLYDAFAPTCASPQLKTLLVAILDTLTPLPADVESSPKPEAGEQSATQPFLQHKEWPCGCVWTDGTSSHKCEFHSNPFAQPAEPKMMPCDHSYMGRPSLCGKCGAWNPLQQSEVPSPQPSEQAKGAEPSDMAKRLTNKLWLNHLGMDVIRNYALEIDAAFAAEMESVKKGASR